MEKRLLTALLATSALALGLAASATAQEKVGDWSRPGQQVLEYVGQVINGSPTAASSRQFGNLLSVAGVDPSSSFTFYTEATTTSVSSNGPLRIIDRSGTTTIYLATSPGSFDTPDTFRAGTPVQVSVLRQQVIVDTTTGLFTVVNLNTITSAQEFQSGTQEVVLGTKGRTFRTELTGRLNSPGASPTGWFGGCAMSQ